MSRRRAVGRPPRQAPYKRTYSDGRVVWIARFRELSGSIAYAKPVWNGNKATFARKSDAQRAIDEALDRLYSAGTQTPESIGRYFEDWLERHPRSDRTNETNEDRVNAVLGVEIEGRRLGEWEFDELRRRQVLTLVDHMLRTEGRAAAGARGILRAFSAMNEDAIGDDAAEVNAFMGVRLRRNDPRIQKPARVPRIWSFEQMRQFAIGGRAEVRARTERPPNPRYRKRPDRKPTCYSAREYEAFLLAPGLTGIRLGELLALHRSDFDGTFLRLRFSAHNGKLVGSSQQKNHDRKIPVPQSLASLLSIQLDSHDSDYIFPTPTGRLFVERNFYREVWKAAQLATGIDPTPHEFRHSYVSHLRAAGIDDADLARVAGHTVGTMVSFYTHALERSHDAIRNVIG